MTQLRPRAMILAAGLGTRLGALSAERPKPMLPVLGLPLVRWVVLWLRRHDIREIVINLHHLGHLIEAELGTGRELGVDIVYSREYPEILGTGGALRQARPHLDDGSGRPIVVVNGKILTELALPDVLRVHGEFVRQGGEATMVLRRDEEAVRWGSLHIDATDRVTRLLERVPAAEPDAPALADPLMFTGIHVLEPRFLDRIPSSGPQCVIRTAYRELFDRARGLNAFVMHDYWWEHSTPERYLQGVVNVLRGRVTLPEARDLGGRGRWPGVDASATIASTAQLVEPVWIGPGAHIDAGARVGPDVQIGARARIAAGVEVRRSVVWDDVTVTRNHIGAVVTSG